MLRISNSWPDWNSYARLLLHTILCTNRSRLVSHPIPHYSVQIGHVLIFHPIPYYSQYKQVTFLLSTQNLRLTFSVFTFLTYVAYCTQTKSETEICTEHERDSSVMVGKVAEILSHECCDQNDVSCPHRKFIRIHQTSQTVVILGEILQQQQYEYQIFDQEVSSDNAVDFRLYSQHFALAAVTQTS